MQPKLGSEVLDLWGREHFDEGVSVMRVDRLTSRSRILTLREVLMKRHCVLKVRLRFWNKRRGDKVTIRQIVDS